MSAFDSLDDLNATVEDCVRTVFPFLSDDEIATASKDALDEWDSLATLSLITLLEETLDVMLTDDEVHAFTSVVDIKSTLALRQGSAA